MVMKKYGKGIGCGWHLESRRHSLARLGIKTGRKSDMGLNKINYAVDNIKQKMQSLYSEAKRLVESGATPAFHLVSASVSPNVMFYVKDEKDYEKYGVTKDYPFIEAQVIDVPLEKWSEATGVDLDEIRILYLGINSDVTDMHNASSSLLNVDEDEFNDYRDDKWSNVSSIDIDNIKKLKKGYDNGELEVLKNQDPHSDFYYYYGNKSEEERYKLAKMVIDDWKEAEAQRNGQKKIPEYAKKQKLIGLRYNDPELHVISDRYVVYKGKDYLTKEDLKYFPKKVHLIDDY